MGQHKVRPRCGLARGAYWGMHGGPVEKVLEPLDSQARSQGNLLVSSRRLSRNSQQKSREDARLTRRT